VVKGREAAVVELQWRRLREMKMGKGGDGVQPFLRGNRQGGSTVLEADNTAKSNAAAGEVESDSWRLEVEDDQRKLDR
jgi:hypothetical protein